MMGVKRFIASYAGYDMYLAEWMGEIRYEAVNADGRGFVFGNIADLMAFIQNVRIGWKW